ncbi:hypothetical protein Xoosp14_232 [Xanthomonas phage Xoo-sp14]|nr:hypothetical protein Xoosp14_232 [Xanthomonas phage Xoo-sp14]
MSMSHEALTLRASLIRLQTVIGLMLETGATVTEEHMQELTKYMGEVGFVNETCLWERAIALLNTGVYVGNTRPAPGTELGDKLHAAAVRAGDANIKAVFSISDSLKKITGGKEYSHGDFHQHLRSNVEYQADRFLSGHPVEIQIPPTPECYNKVTLRNQALVQYLFDTIPTIRKIVAYNDQIGVSTWYEFPRSIVQVRIENIDGAKLTFTKTVDEKLVPGTRISLPFEDNFESDEIPYKKLGMELVRDLPLPPIQVLERATELLEYYRDDADKYHPTNANLAMCHGFWLTQNELETDFRGKYFIELSLDPVSDEVTLVVKDMDNVERLTAKVPHQYRSDSMHYTFNDPKAAVEKVKDLLSKGFIQGSIQWPTARKLAAAMATNGVRLIINAKGDPKYIYTLDLNEDTGFVLLKIEDLAGNVLHAAPVMDLMHLGSRNWETPVKEMALELINSAGQCSFADCQAVENELAKKFTTEYLDHKLKGFKMVGVQAFKYANTGRPFFMVTVTADALEQPTLFPVYMD